MLQELLADQTGMPGRAASHDDEACGGEQTRAVVTHGGEDDGVVEEASAHAVAQTTGLVKDLLQHIVGEAATVEHVKIHVDLSDIDIHVLVAQVDDPQRLSRMADGNLLVVDINDILGIFGDGRGIGGDEELAVVLRHADDEGRAFACGNECMRIALVDHGDGVGTDTLAQGMTHGLHQRALVLLLSIFNKLHKHLGIGVALEMEPALLQLLTKDNEVLDDAVMHKRDVSRLGDVRVCVPHRRLSVRSPTGMRDADAAAAVLSCRGIL